MEDLWRASVILPAAGDWPVSLCRKNVAFGSLAVQQLVLAFHSEHSTNPVTSAAQTKKEKRVLNQSANSDSQLNGVCNQTNI
jgi:hypothetical protein